MADVTHLFRCKRCGNPGRRRDLLLNEEIVGEIRSCDACIEQTEKELARVRPVFEAMIAAGVNRKAANYLMMVMLDHPDVFKPDPV